MKIKRNKLNIRFAKKLIHIKASKDRRAHSRNIKVSEIDKVNKVYNQLCSEMNIVPVFISSLNRLKQRVEELTVKARKMPGSMFYMT